MKRTVAVNERGRRIGEDHQRAKLTNHDVELMRELRAAGWSLRKIAAKFDVTYGTVWYITTCQRRAQLPVAWKTLDR